VHEYHIKIEDLNRTVVDMNSQKQKLQMESQEVSQTNDCIFLEKVYWKNEWKLTEKILPVIDWWTVRLTDWSAAGPLCPVFLTNLEGKVGKIGKVGNVGKVDKVGRVGKVGKVGKEGKEGRLRE
jgi:hypothetical protein